MSERVRVPSTEPDQTEQPQLARAAAAPVQRVLQLQRTAGNQAVGRILARNGDGPATKAPEITDWPAEFRRAAGAGEWETAALATAKVDNAMLLTLLGELSQAQLTQLDAGAKGPLAAAIAGLTDRVHRHISFTLHAPATPGEQTTVTVNKEGTLGADNSVGGGQVQVHTGGEFELTDGRKFSEMFSLSYKGADSKKTRWLQFIWREIEVEDPTKGNFRVNQSITTTGGSYNLTTDPAAPNYNTDTASTTSPFYEAGGAANRTADATSIFDQPSAMTSIVNAQIDGGATKVTSRAHFVTYLVRDMEVLHEVKIDIEWVFTDKTVPPRTQSVSSAQNVSALDPIARTRLIAQFPNFDYLP